MKNIKWILLPVIISLIYFAGVFLQDIYETPLSIKNYEESIRISNSKGLWQKLTSAQIIELAQIICDKIAQDTGLQPITVVQHDFGSNSRISMDWNRGPRLVRVNLNSVGLSPHKFINSLGHEILGHAVQDALIAGEDIAVKMPEEIIEIWRENKSAYIRPPLPHDYNISDAAAKQKWLSYRTQSVETHANRAGTDFRNQTRQIVVRLPDDIEFKIVFILAMFILGWILLKLDLTSDLNFAECVRAIHDKDIISAKPLKILKNLHEVLSDELGMKPLGARMSRNGKKRTSYDWIVFNENCLSNPDYIIAEVAGETWRVCNYEFGEDISAGMADYIDEIMFRAENVIKPGEPVKRVKYIFKLGEKRLWKKKYIRQLKKRSRISRRFSQK